MKKRTITILFIGSLLLICFIVTWLQESNHWTVKNIDDKTVFSLPKKITTVEEGLIIASEWAKKWNSQAELDYINICLTNKDQIKEKSGVISYSFFAENHNNLGYKGAHYYININLGDNPTFSQKLIADDKANRLYQSLSLGKIDLIDLYQILNKPEIFRRINGIDDLLIIATVEPVNWTVSIYTNRQGHGGESFSITIDPNTKNYYITDEK